MPDQAVLEANVLEAARRSGVTYCAKLSTATAVLEMQQGGPYPAHLEVEALLADSGLAYTVLRPNLFMDMAQRGFLGIGDMLQHADQCEHPFADASISMIDVRDVADVARTLFLHCDRGGPS